MKFSEAVSERARAMCSQYALFPQATKVVTEIAYLNWIQEVSADMHKLVEREPNFKLSRPLSEHRENIIRSKLFLVRHKISDDLTATAYMDEIEPKLKDYLARYQDLEERQRRQRVSLMESFV